MSFYFIFPTIAEHLSFWVTVISIGHGFGTSQLLFFFVLFEIRCNIFLCVCYYHYHYYHQIIIFFKFTHLIHAFWVGQLHGNFSKVVWTIAISAEKFLSTIPFFFHYWKRAGVLKSRPAIWVNTFHYFYLYGPINWGKISPNSWIDVSTSFLLSRTK